jgi:hypothetical protein
MDQGPLVKEQIDAGARFLTEFQKYAPVQATFWLKESDEGEWYLYVASDQITDDNFDLGYGEVARLNVALKDPWFDPFQVKLIGMGDPLAQAALDHLRRFPGRGPARVHGETFGSVAVDEVYLYPSPLPVPTA